MYVFNLHQLAVTFPQTLHTYSSVY